MIFLRRAMAVLLGVVLVLLFGAGTLLARVSETVLEPEFVTQELDDLDVYDFLYDEVLPAVLDEVMSEQLGALAGNLEGVELPSDAASQRVVLELLRDVVPPEFIQSKVEHALGEFLPFLVGDTDDFTIRFALSERVLVALDHPAGEPSTVERSFRELNIGRLVIDAALDQFAGSIAEEGLTTREDALELLSEQVPDRDAAGEWFTENLFRAVDSMLPYLLGESEGFTIRIRFVEEFPLAEPLSFILQRPAEELLAEGFLLTDQDVNEALSAGGDATAEAVQEEIDRRLELVREDFVYTADEFREDLRGDLAGGGTGDIDVDQLREWARQGRIVMRWSGIAVSLLLAVLIGVLGGRRWPTRLLWGAGALVVAAAPWYALSGPLYRARAVPEIRSRLLTAFDGWPAAYDPVRLGLIDRAITFSDDFAGGIELRTMVWLLASVAVVFLAALWAILSRRQLDPAPVTGAPDGEPAWESPAPPAAAPESAATSATAADPAPASPPAEDGEPVPPAPENGEAEPPERDRDQPSRE